MPVPDVDQAPPTGSPRPPYVYAAGSAHRDWRLLLRAFELIPDRHCIVATQSLDTGLTPIPPNVELLPAQTVADGRVLMQHSTLVAVTFEDTDLACGPTIILDAYAMGIPVVSSDTNGSRDYVRDGVTGLLSPPDDPAKLAEHIDELLHSDDRRTAMSQAIESISWGELSRTVFEERLGRHLRTAVSEAGRRPR
jgi:glycosyltransferase involved in cell wall biosynthesis